MVFIDGEVGYGAGLEEAEGKVLPAEIVLGVHIVYIGIHWLEVSVHKV
jgi:hypothetical protein